MPFANKAILAQMKAEAWIIEPRYLDSFFLVLETGEPLDLDTRNSETRDTNIKINNGTAIIPIRGILLKEEIPFFSWFGIENTTYPNIRKQVAQALGSDEVKSILLEVDSPGGQVAGGMETAMAISDANKQKQVNAHISDLGASGAYWLASQAGNITANPNAMVGSIGVYMVFEDSSKQAENEGVKVKIIRSGEHKGMGIPGAPITDEQVAAMQEVVDGTATNFIKAVAKGRGMKEAEVRTLADGRIWLAGEAQKLNLIDGQQIEAKVTKPKIITKGTAMSENEQTQTESPPAEDLDQIKAQATTAERDRFGLLEAAFPDEIDFVAKQFRAGNTVEQAKLAFNAVLTERLAATTKELGELKAKESKPDSNQNSAPGASPTPHNEAAQGGEDFREVVKTLAATEKIGIREASVKVARDNPELHAAWLAKQQPRQRPRR